ncbi:hypothetical protein [Microviridae sp.]|nr:hypothetical protein [Microviridae sp.]
MALDERGWEVPDPTPVAWPAGVRRPETLTEQIRRLVRIEVSQRAAEQGHETFEEADDFEMDDDDEFRSPYELTEMQEERIMGRDASDLERPNPEKESGKAEQSRVASGESVSQSSGKDVRAESHVGEDSKPAGSSAEGYSGRA